MFHHLHEHARSHGFRLRAPLLPGFPWQKALLVVASYPEVDHGLELVLRLVKNPLASRLDADSTHEEGQGQWALVAEACSGDLAGLA